MKCKVAFFLSKANRKKKLHTFCAKLFNSFACVQHYNLADSSLPALNLATFFALIFITAPVWGLRPLRAALLDTENVPKPTRVTFPPPFKVLVTASTKESKEALAWVLVTHAS